LEEEIKKARQEVGELYYVSARLLQKIVLNPQFGYQILDIAEGILEKVKQAYLEEIFNRFSLYFQVYQDQREMVESRISEIVDPFKEKIEKLKA
jgi:transcriptional regulator